MRTVIVSDLHLGNGQGYDIFAGAEALPAFLEQFTREPTRVVFNGDSVDFLMNEDPLELTVERAVAQARAMVDSAPTSQVFRALGRVLAAGGEGVVRLGNHDVELALPEVREVFRQALGQPPEVARRLVFESGDAPRVLEVGGARVLLAHGEQNDAWNKVDYARLPGPGVTDASGFTYAVGSLLVKKLLNPLKREYGMRFADLLVPDMRGAVMAALAVNPGAVKLVFQRSSLNLLWQLLRRGLAPVTFNPEDEPSEPELGLAERVKAAGLTEQEELALEELLSDGPLSFGGDASEQESARTKLGLHALRAYARLHRALAGAQGERYFDLAPTEPELEEARRLARKYTADAVIFGHTHAARWQRAEDVLYANSGTWIWLMRLPAADAPESVWTEFLQELRNNPGLDAGRQVLARLESRFNAVLCGPHAAGGAEVSLVEWKPDAGIQVLASARVAPTRVL
ncbi:MAG TPA: metallophosphoesterase [Archangium sp.]|uniref:metallophosphoesterase n=1 Tax=Archangium sp. TaxID=1872627 RepID=UPI002E35A50D|nr:metallophosphoesterase [Archangium sp.]HEX5746150.1 metallophosphoesterase [Archangium sp.]